MSVDVDITTGLPKKEAERLRQQKIAENALSLKTSLSSEQGLTFLSYLEEALLSRLLALMKEDETCKLITSLCSTIGTDLKIAEKLSAKFFENLKQPE